MLWSWNASGQLELNVQDRGSTNGSKLNSVRLDVKTWYPVRAGDILLIGTTQFTVICAAASDNEKNQKKSAGSHGRAKK